jgi:hypothetical protein
MMVINFDAVEDKLRAIKERINREFANDPDFLEELKKTRKNQ